ncbi:hypothetical protein JCM3775_003848 [Rhodotorula graminis]
MAGAAGAVAASAGWVDSAPLRDYWTALAAVLALCLLAYLTNPTPASFSTHVTSLCFHAHIRRCDQLPLHADSHGKQAATTRAGGTATANGTSTTSAHANGKDPSNPPASAATHGRRKGQAAVAVDPRAAAKRAVPDRHVLSFSNRINLSIKTHTYSYTSYHLFSTVFVPSARPPPASAGLRKQQRRHPELSALLGLGGELWLGLFGNWYALRWWAGPEGEDGERKGRLETGVREMSIEDDERDADFPTSSANPSTAASASGASTPASHPLSHNPSSSIDHRVSVPLSSTADPTSPPSPTKTSPAAARLSKRVFRAGQRRSSPTSLTRLKTKAEHAAREAAEAERAATDDAASPTKGAAGSPLGAGLGDAAGNGLCGAPATDPIVVELQAQLDELRASAVESEKRLQDELEVLRGKKRDEDAFRAELKAKTKQLEEAKRAAEASRVEAEKELSERKGVVKEAQGRVDKLRDEIRALERKGLEAIERKEKKKRERKEREKKLRDDVAKKRDELREKEEGLADVMRKVGEMERKLEVRRALLAGRRAELAQYAVSGMRGGGIGVAPGGAMYGMAPPHLLPATATLGGVGAMANAFAAPFGQGGYGRRNYPYVHPLSANNSRPTSIRSGHFDPHTGAFQSAPSSPTMSHPVSPHDDPSPYASHHSNGASDPTGGWPTSFPSAANGGSHALPQSGAAGAGHAAGFLEHRMQHRAAHGDEVLPAHFLPFDFDGLGPAADADNEPSPQHRTTRAGSLSNEAGLDDHSPGGTAVGKPRTLALPMQYLDSGLLAGTDSPGLMDGPLSPMTPHQTSLIPSQLFHLLDDDEDDDGLFVVPDSPTLRAGVGMGLKGVADWQGLGLDAGALGGGRRASEEVKREEPAAAVEDAGDEQAADKAAPVERQRSPPVLSPRVEAFVNAEMASTTTSPIGPPPSSPFSPWAADPIGPPSATPSPAMTPATIGFDLSALKGMSAAPGSGGAHALHRVSPSQDLDDDLPRAGLSLNPGAKAFAFPFAHSHTRTSSVPLPPASMTAAVRATRSGTMSSFPSSGDGRSASTTTVQSPIAAAPAIPAPVGSGLALSPPAKSRMEFARVVSDPAVTSTSSSVSAANIAAPLSARLSPGFDWPSVASGSPVFAAPQAPGASLVGGDKVPTPTSATSAAPGSALFNPFDEEDELLGPLRK